MTDRGNVVWITLESIRYDHTSASGYDRDTTPSLRRIADGPSGAAFDRCITHGNWTGTSSASILTGTTPPTHGIYGESELVLPESVRTIPELLPEEYATRSLISNPNAGPARGLDRGFDDVRFVVPSRLREDVGWRPLLGAVPELWTHGGGLTTDVDRHKGLSSYLAVDLARRFLRSGEEPYFLYLHLGSSHHPYLPPPAFAGRFADDLSTGAGRALDLVQSRYADVHELIADGGLPAAELPAVEAMYDAVVAHVDHCVGLLYGAVRRHDPEATVVVTADHGDLLGEHGLVGHKFVLDDALVRVPLVTHNLDGVGDRTDDVVQHADVVRTLLAERDVADDQLEGIDLRTERREHAVTQRSGTNAVRNLEQVREHAPDFESPTPHLSTLTSVRSTDHKLLHSEDAVELFEPPDESTDLAGRRPATRERLVAAAEAWLEDHQPGPAARRERELDADVRNHLSDMGYLV